LKTTPIPVKFDRQGHSCNFYGGFGPTEIKSCLFWQATHKFAKGLNPIKMKHEEESKKIPITPRAMLNRGASERVTASQT